ncbi:LysR family transcriptional regulator [Rhodococcus sp. NPDC057297]|uniref:LysR family transcriptional regulator n=1 Tax=Rhodococcus sp. NPDC057297 TaxID=3346090 RepID=UPI00362A9264
MNFDVQMLRWYIAVAEELHFARAAKKLNIARTKLSAAVIDMEAELGCPLFSPGVSPTQLSAEGREFLVTARARVAEDEVRLRAEAARTAAEAATLTVGFTEGVTPTKWSRIWAERFEDIALELVPTTVDTQLDLLRSGAVDAGFVRLPVDRDGLSVVALYEEVPVVVVPKDHAVAAFDRIAVTDLADEHLLQSPEDMPEWAAVATEIADGTALPVPDISSNSELVEYVAAGLGLAIVPQSIARLHSRKDLVYRPVDGVAGSTVALAWPSEKNTENVEEFFGIVRGRSTRSSRGKTADQTRKPNQIKKPAAPSGRTQSGKAQSGKAPRKAGPRKRPKR